MTEHLAKKRPRTLDFNSLPDEVLLQILRFTSAQPHRDNWKKYTSRDVSLGILLTGSRLSKLVWAEELDLGSNQFVLSGDTLSVTACPGFRDTLLFEFITTVKHLMRSFYFDNQMRRKSPRLCAGIISSRSLRCLEVKMCAQTFDLCRLLEACTGQLLELDVRGPHLPDAHIKGISRLCVGMQKVTLLYDTYGDLSCIWSVLAPTVGMLRVKEYMLITQSSSFYGIWDNFSRIGFQHPNLQLNRCHTKVQSPRVVAVYENSAVQVRWLQLTDECPLKNLRSVLKWCKNTVVDMECVTGDAAKYIDALGSQARKITIAVSDPIGSDVPAAIKKCKNLEVLDIAFCAGFAKHFFKVMLSVPKPYLKSVSIKFGREAVDGDENSLRLLGTRVHSLRHFYCEADDMYQACFASLARGNKRLKSVELVLLHTESSDESSGEDEGDMHSYEEGIAISVLTDFAECPDLERLILQGEHLTSRSTAIAEECESYATRKVKIIIGGIVYSS